MNLPDYIRSIGEERASAEFGVSVWTIRSWRQRTRFPRIAKAVEIVSKSRGAVTMDVIFGQDVSAKPSQASRKGRAAA